MVRWLGGKWRGVKLLLIIYRCIYYCYLMRSCIISPTIVNSTEEESINVSFKKMRFPHKFRKQVVSNQYRKIYLKKRHIHQYDLSNMHIIFNLQNTYAVIVRSKKNNLLQIIHERTVKSKSLQAHVPCFYYLLLDQTQLLPYVQKI